MLKLSVYIKINSYFYIHVCVKGFRYSVQSYQYVETFPRLDIQYKSQKEKLPSHKPSNVNNVLTNSMK